MGFETKARPSWQHQDRQFETSLWDLKHGRADGNGNGNGVRNLPMGFETLALQRFLRRFLRVRNLPMGFETSLRGWRTAGRGRSKPPYGI